MPDTDPAAQAIQTTEPAAFDWDSDENPWKQNFQNYRVEADRRNTKLSQYETLLEDLRSPDLDRQRKAAQELGVELVEDDPVYADPTDALAAQMDADRQKLAALEQRLADRDRADEEARFKSRVNDALGSLGLDSADEDWVLARAVALGKDESGLPKLKEAYDQLRARDEAVVQNWAKRKPRTSVGPGSTASETKPVHEMDDAERVEWAYARLQDAA